MQSQNIVVKREDVYKAIDSERTYQEQLSRNDVTDQTPLEQLALIRSVIRRAEDKWYDAVGEFDMHFMRKIAGIAVRCMEQHGAPLREIPAPAVKPKRTKKDAPVTATEVKAAQAEIVAAPVPAFEEAAAAIVAPVVAAVVPPAVIEKKEEIVAAPVAPPVVQAVATPSPAPALTIEIVGGDLMKLVQMGRREAALGILAKFGVQKARDIKPEQFAEAYKLIQEASKA